MRYETDQKFWVVTDPTPESELADIFFAASLRDLELQFRGGLTCEHNPTLFTERAEAEADAQKSLEARDAAIAVLRNVEDPEGLKDLDRIEIINADG